MIVPLVAFWGSVSLVAWVLAGFPAVVLARARFRPRPFAEDQLDLGVSVVVAAHNEGGVIADKLASVATTEYLGSIEVIVASDGSTDDTVEKARAAGATVLDLPRVGKAAALNAAIETAAGRILVFTDANSMLMPGSLPALLAPFADPEVGGVAGNQVYTTSDGEGAGERAHWNIDRRLKAAESRAGNTISATGALYAMRAELVGSVIEGVTDDFYVSTGVIARGYRLVFAPLALAIEPVATSDRREFARKERIMTRGFAAVWERRELLNPRRTGFYAVQLISYKVLRRLLAIPIILLTLSAPLLWRRSPVYRLATAALGLFWAAAVGGHSMRGHRLGRTPPLAIPAFVAQSMLASLRAAYRAMTGQTITVWDSGRHAAAGAVEDAAA